MTELARMLALKESGELHHVTYRCQGTLWEGLWFYRKSETGRLGFDVAGCVNKADPEYAAAEAATAGWGIHVGSYGNG